FLEDGLAMAGYDVDTATNGREALRKIEQGDYDLIICDVRMPELDGVGLCRALAEQSAHALAHLVFLTTPDLLEANEAFFAGRGVPVLTKPIGLDDLCEVVARMIEHISLVEPVPA